MQPIDRAALMTVVLFALAGCGNSNTATAPTPATVSSAPVQVATLPTQPPSAVRKGTTKAPPPASAEEIYRELNQFQSDITLWHQKETSEGVARIRKLQALRARIDKEWPTSEWCAQAAQYAEVLASDINVLDNGAKSGGNVNLPRIHQIINSASHFGGQLEACSREVLGDD